MPKGDDGGVGEKPLTVFRGPGVLAHWDAERHVDFALACRTLPPKEKMLVVSRLGELEDELTSGADVQDRIGRAIRVLDTFFFESL